MSDLAVPQTEPRISVNKLGEYLSANPLRRRRIIADQKHKPPFKVLWYAKARPALVEYFAAGCDPSVIEAAIESLDEGPFDSDRAEQDAAASSEALDLFLEFADTIAFPEAQFRRGPSSAPRLTIEGVDVSVGPDLLVTGTTAKGQRYHGVIKFHIVKTHPLTPEAGQCAALLLKRWMEANAPDDDSEVIAQHCRVIDVFAQQVHAASKSEVRRMRLVEAACSEIAAGWPSV